VFGLEDTSHEVIELESKLKRAEKALEAYDEMIRLKKIWEESYRRNGIGVGQSFTDYDCAKGNFEYFFKLWKEQK
jgi:hypothetical protein